MPMLSLLGANNHPPLFFMAKLFICINETKQRINEFTIGHMINPGLHYNRKLQRTSVKMYVYYIW